MKIKEALYEAQGWIIESFGWLIDGWKLIAGWLSDHRNINLAIIVALLMIAVKF